MVKVLERIGNYVELTEENGFYGINICEDNKVIIKQGPSSNETVIRKEFERITQNKNVCLFHSSTTYFSSSYDIFQDESGKINMKVGGLVVPLELNQIGEIGIDVFKLDNIDYDKFNAIYNIKCFK